MRKSLPPLLAALALASPAFAHVSAEPAKASAGAYQVVRFRVGHGCGKAATTALRIELPPQLASARPQPKPGWDLRIERDGDRVAAIAWTGELPDEQFDDFAILARLPAEPGQLYFPAVQTCGSEEQQWTGVPDPGETGLSHPAPTILVTPAEAAAETHHH